MPNNLIRRDSQIQTFRDVNRLLTSALDRNGYVEKSYYAVPLGFALVTRLEQIDLDGRSKVPPARWSAGPQTPTNFSLSAYVRALLTANPGYYRLIVLIVTRVPFTQSEREITQSEAALWLRAGLNILPESIGARLYEPDVMCTALIYEFEGKGSAAPRILLPSRLDAHTHLANSGLWGTLGGN